MFCLICMDRPESQDLRLANRADHLAYVQENPGVIVAGPFLGEDGTTMIGSLIVLDVKTRAEAES
ncbi:MAG: YciI family protein, partial [Pseudomonadota bacterium]|nr:YciI family protein [Pseudomonadota bacterium]